MKKIIGTCLAISLLLCGCAGKAGEGGTTDSDTIDREIPSPEQIALDAAEARAEYYQKLVSELQKEILNLKSEQDDARVEYESRIEELEAELGKPSTSEATDFRYIVSGGKVTVTAYLGSQKRVEIPTTIASCPVVAIADRAFENNLTVEEVALPDGIASIGWFAFAGCISLKKGTVPNDETP